MRLPMLKWIHKLKGIFNLNPTRANVDEVIEDNMNQMKQIRMNRIRFYKFSRRAEAYYR